jgi:serine/threonine protein kinase
MGNSSLRPALADAVTFQADLPKFILQSKIGNGKLMKTYSMRCESNFVVVKVYMSQPDEDLRFYASKLTHIWYTLSPSRFPNLLPYQLWMKSTTRQPKSGMLPIYLIRQYLFSNLHDRMSTRPFLSDIEKLWIVYQLFRCLETCHNLDIMHGDLKPENILCTTSNWVVLTDFAAFKPVNLPDDDPSIFQYFFDSMSRPRCYIAPERFYNKSSTAHKQNIANSSSPSNKQSVVSSTRGENESGLLSDSLFGDAAAAVRFESQGYSASSGSLDGDQLQSTAERRSKEKFKTGVVARDEFDVEKAADKLTVAMDVFSLGCTISEVDLLLLPI